MSLIVACVRRFLPAIPLAQVLPRDLGGDCSFTVNEQNRIYIPSCLPMGCHKIVIGLVPASARNNTRHSAFESRLSEEVAESFAAESTQVVRIPASFHVDSGYQRFPPNSPRLQSVPSAYFSNHSERSSALRRRSVVAPSCFSQTMIASGTLLRESIRMSE